MSKLIIEILADYGTIPHRIGKFLQKRSGSHINDIIIHTSLTRVQVVQGLSLMIQRRFIKYFQYEGRTYYSLDVDMVCRMMFYSMYLRLVEDEFGCDIADRFMNILINGFVRRKDGRDIPTELLNAGVIVFLNGRAASALAIISKEPSGVSVGNKMRVEDVSSDRKSRRISDDSGFYIVDFNILDSIMIDKRILAFVRRRYSTEAEDIYRTILKCNLVTPDAILEHLSAPGITHGSSMSKDCVTSYLKYLSSCRILKKSLDGSEIHFKDSDGIRRILIIDSLNKILSRSCSEARRLFNLMI